MKKVKFNIPNSKIPASDDNTFNSKNDQTKENMIVAVRVRPLNNKELEYSNIETIKINKEIVTVLATESDYKSQDNSATANKNRIREQQYAFDVVFNKNASQEEVYHHTTKFLLKGVLEGFNATVFAYGASGSGKTHTMVGHGENPGVMVRSVSDLFELVEVNKEKNSKVIICYFEVYNETLRDLLSDVGSEIDMREDPHKGTTLVGLTEIQVTNASEVFRLLM